MRLELVSLPWSPRQPHTHPMKPSQNLIKTVFHMITAWSHTLGLTQQKLSLLHSLTILIKVNLQPANSLGRPCLFLAHCSCLPQLTNKKPLSHYQRSGLRKAIVTLPGQHNFVNNCIMVKKKNIALRGRKPVINSQNPQFINWQESGWVSLQTSFSSPEEKAE